MTQPGRTDSMGPWDTIRKYRSIIGAFAAATLLVSVGVLITRDDTDGDLAELDSPSSSTSTTSDAEVSSGVPSIDCNRLLSTEAMSEALGASERPAGEQGSIGFSRGEVCTLHLEVDDRVFVAIQPGEVGDFESGTELLGVVGEPVEVLADDALWFGGDGEGVLSVRHDTSLGLLVYRIGVARPDIDDAARVDIARTLADQALRNFPGVTGLPPEPKANLCDLVSDIEAEAILSQYRDVHPATRDEVVVIANSSGPVDLTRYEDLSCKKLILAEVYLEVTPGNADDFEPGAQIDGVAGEPVADIGDDAVWFASVPTQASFSAPHNRWILSVRRGDAVFRIALALPDTAEEDLLGMAADLALRALARIPGADPLELTYEPDAEDISRLGYAGNLIAKEADGEWSLGEGLVSTLRLFVGELEPEQVIRQPDLADYSTTEVLAMASEYLRTGDDQEAKTEIRRLLEMVVPSLALLEGSTQAPDSSADERELLVSTVFLVQADEEETPQEWCMRVFGVDAPCLTGYLPPSDQPDDEEPPPDAEEPPDEEPESSKYRVFVPKDLAAAGWSSDYADWAYEAMLESAQLYETLGDMPSASVTLWPEFENHAELDSSTGHCSITIGTKSQDPIEAGGESKGPFQQRIAARMALCLLLSEGTESAWWGQGMPIYLSGVVYPDVNLEHLLSDFLRLYELDLGLLERRWINWVFFERLHPQNGAAGNLSFARASLTQIAAEFHLLGEDLSDVTVPDVGPGLVPYDPPRRVLDLSGPTQALVQPGHFGIQRIHVTIPDGKIVCEVEYDQQAGVTVSWRPGAPGAAGGAWSRDLPSDPSGEMVFVVTGSADDSQLVADFKKVEDADDGCEEESESDSSPPDFGNVLPCCDSDYYK